MQNVLHDVRYALRQLRTSPGFTITAILTLALGIGATTAVFSVVDGVLLRPLPFPHPEQLVALGDHVENVDIGGNGRIVAPPEIPVYMRDTKSFTHLGAYRITGFELAGGVQPEDVTVARMGASVFPALGVRPLLGRTFTPQEDTQARPVAVLSYATWKARYHGDPGILGRTILLDRKPYVVIGVMPRNFEFPLMAGQLSRTELWVPLSLTSEELTKQAGSWNFPMVGRLKAGVTVAQARADANHVAQEILRNSPAFMRDIHMSAVVEPLKRVTVADARPLLRVLFLAVLVVLLIACANLAGLLLVRAIRRRKETALRLALGASAATLMRQTLLESLVLSISGGILGTAMAAVLLRVGVAFLPENLPRINNIRMNGWVAGFAVLLAIATGAICALAPAFAAIRTDMNDALKESGRSGSAGGSHVRLRSMLVIAEIAVALVLVVASGLLLRSFQKMRDVALGFHPGHVLVAMYGLPQKQYASQASVDAFNRELLRRVRALPGVSQIGLGSDVPMSGSTSNWGFVAEGYVQPKGSATNIAEGSQVTGDYFRSLGIPLLRGRFFTRADDAQAPLVVIVNRKLAEHYWPGQSPLGKRIALGAATMHGRWMTIVGEIADAKIDSPDTPTSEQLYQPVAQQIEALGQFASPGDLGGANLYVVLRTTGAPAALEISLRGVFHSLDPQLAVMQLQTMGQAVSATEAPRRFNTSLISAFGMIAVLLAMLGIYSVIAFTVALRTQEMAIRIALGSSRAGIRRLILGSGVKLAAIGCAIGLAGAIGVSRLLTSLLFQVDPFDPMVLIGGAAVILALSLAASALPARRAASVDPMQALRSE